MVSEARRGDREEVLEGYVPVAEMRRRVAPEILCVRCLSRSEKDRLVCRDCVRELDIIRWKRTAGGEGPRGGSSLALFEKEKGLEVGGRKADGKKFAERRKTGTGGWRGEWRRSGL